MINTSLFLLLLTTFAVSPIYAGNLHPDDPFSKVEHITLPNGLQLFLAPSNEASLTSIHLEVGVGTESEVGPTIGVSHLLEHVLFRDKNLTEEMSYLQLIKEAGGQANGGTYDRKTTYFGSIPATKGIWLLETFGKMILQPSFEDRYVQKEKGTIEMERGRPSPLGQTLGFDPISLLYPQHLRRDNFWESEFNYRRASQYSLLDEQLATQKLTANQVQNHYHDYYYAKNMKLFVAGNYDRERLMAEINKSWSPLPPKVGKTLPQEASATLKKSPYLRLTLDNEPSVYLGYKIWDADEIASNILQSYTSYLAHRMMKEIRNIKGQTYTAYQSNRIYKGFGYVTVNFRTPKENFDENLALAKSYFDEAREGKLSAEQVQEAVKLELAEYNLRGREASDMMKLAQDYDEIIGSAGRFISPYTSLASVTPEQYNATLKKHLIPEMSYEYLSKPPIFFHYDKVLLYGLSLVLLFMGLRRILTQKFENDKVRWVRKVEYPPLKIAEGLALIAAYFIYLHAQYVIDDLFYTRFMQSNLFFSQYLYIVASMAALIVVAQGVYSFMPRKLMIHGDSLLIKSVTYFSREIPLNEIAKVETIRPLTYPFPVSTWLKSVKHRYFFMTPMFWKKGLLVTMKSGKGYFFSLKDADKAKLELSGILSRETPNTSSKMAA